LNQGLKNQITGGILPWPRDLVKDGYCKGMTTANPREGAFGGGPLSRVLSNNAVARSSGQDYWRTKGAKTELSKNVPREGCRSIHVIKKRVYKIPAQSKPSPTKTTERKKNPQGGKKRPNRGIKRITKYSITAKKKKIKIVSESYVGRLRK